ncbi:hypothetical protein IP88_14355 [alpha proteobacterium AAP81b]|nr:hypothetical protein IP88_14355 [alpha proteobacterium AAP81b]
MKIPFPNSVAGQLLLLGGVASLVFLLFFLVVSSDDGLGIGGPAGIAPSAGALCASDTRQGRADAAEQCSSDLGLCLQRVDSRLRQNAGKNRLRDKIITRVRPQPDQPWILVAQDSKKTPLSFRYEPCQDRLDQGTSY